MEQDHNHRHEVIALVGVLISVTAMIITIFQFRPEDQLRYFRGLGVLLLLIAVPMIWPTRWWSKLLPCVLAAVGVSILILAPGAIRSESQKGSAIEKPLRTGIEAFKDGRFDDAVKELTQAIKLDMSNCEAHFWRGAAYLSFPIPKCNEALVDFVGLRCDELKEELAKSFRERGCEEKH